jgi:hypothetical protein
LLATINRAKDLTSSRLVAWIGEPHAFICQLVPVIERANPPKGEFFGALACPKTSIVKFNHPFDQSGQVHCHLQFSSPVINEHRSRCLFAH